MKSKKLLRNSFATSLSIFKIKGSKNQTLGRDKLNKCSTESENCHF